MEMGRGGVVHTPIELYPSISGDTLQLLEQWLPPGRTVIHHTEDTHEHT